jgi:hypothetical protein
METTELKPQTSWLPAFVSKTVLLEGVQSQILSWDALEADLARRTHFHGCLMLFSVNIQIRALYLDGLKVGMTWACHSSVTMPSTELREHTGRVSLYELELGELLRILRHDAVAVRAISSDVINSLSFGGEGLVTYIHPEDVGFNVVNSTPRTTPPIHFSAIPPSVTVSSQIKNSEPSLETVCLAWNALLGHATQLMAQSADATGVSTFERAWRSSCNRLADRFPILDPFAAEIEWSSGQLRLETESISETVQALSEAFLQTIIALGAKRQSVEGLKLREFALRYPHVGLETLIQRIEQGR